MPSSSASEEDIAEYEALVMVITKPVSDAEAALLVELFGPDDCCGLAWTLVHLIESAPGPLPISAEPLEGENEWITALRDAERRARG